MGTGDVAADAGKTAVVSRIVGHGAEAHRTVQVGRWRLEASASNNEPQIRDIDLAERLEYEHPRNIRRLIAGLIKKGKLRDVDVRSATERTSMPQGGEREVEVNEYWLTEAQALKVIAKSETPAADALLDEMIEVFRLAIRGLLGQVATENKLSLFLLDEAAQWEKLFGDALGVSIARLYDCDYIPGKPPGFFRSIWARIYCHLLGKDVFAEMRIRNPAPEKGEKLHQQLTPDARRLMSVNLPIVQALAQQSRTKAEFWARMQAQYGGMPLQFGFGFS